MTSFSQSITLATRIERISLKSGSMTSGKQIQNELLRNTVAEMLRQKWTNWRRKSGQTGGAARLALATIWNDLPKFWQRPGPLHVPQNPNMCAMWGGTSHIFSARSFWSKITRSEGVRSSNWLSSQLENLTRSHPPQCGRHITSTAAFVAALSWAHILLSSAAKYLFN